ncbi:MAG: flagellar biosynthesis protein FlgA, partial [Betaproteobacteria bacterium]
MNLHILLQLRAANNQPVLVVLIGAGKFGSMFLSQAPRTPGFHIIGIADLSPSRAMESLARVGWPKEKYAATSIEGASKSGATFITDDAVSLIASPYVDVVIDATGSPSAGIAHVLACCTHKK